MLPPRFSGKGCVSCKRILTSLHKLARLIPVLLRHLEVLESGSQETVEAALI